jgi:hypothetical protein
MERHWKVDAPEELGHLYSKLKDDVAFRQVWVERVGLGFELVPVGPQNSAAAESEKVA